MEFKDFNTSFWKEKILTIRLSVLDSTIINKNGKMGW